MKPRVLFVSRSVELPLSDGERRKWDALAGQLEVRVLAARRGDGSRDGFHLFAEPPVLAGAAFYAGLPARIAGELRSFRPHAVLVHGLHETAAALAARTLSRTDPAVIADVHGDWRAPTRLFGSRLRAALSPLSDRVAEAAIRRADGVRSITAYTSRRVRELGVEPTAEFPAYMDFASFVERPPLPLPERPQALFVGVLERDKNVDGLAAAWRLAAARAPSANLRLVGTGTLTGVVERLAGDLPGQVTWTGRVPQSEVASALDESTCLVLPSRSEGMGRVVIEAFCRGRGVVGSRVGGIPDLVEENVNGLLVDPGDVDEIANALVTVLSDRELAERLGRAAQAGATQWTISPEEFALRLRELVDRVTGLS